MHAINYVYEAQMSTLFHCSIDKCIGWLCCGNALKDGLPTEGVFKDEIPSHAIEQTNQDVQQEDRHSQYTSSA